MVLDELLSERERIGKMVEHAVENDSKHVTGIRLMDIDMPEDLKRIMSRQAGAEREKRATATTRPIINKKTSAARPVGRAADAI